MYYISDVKIKYLNVTALSETEVMTFWITEGPMQQVQRFYVQISIGEQTIYYVESYVPELRITDLMENTKYNICVHIYFNIDMVINSSSACEEVTTEQTGNIFHLFFDFLKSLNDNL